MKHRRNYNHTPKNLINYKYAKKGLRKLIVWHNLNDDTYFYKFSRMTYKRYKIGDKNQYNHQVILILDEEEIQPIIKKITYVKEYVSFKKKVLTRLISFLQKLNK